MSEEEINEAIEYNLEYMEAIQSEELFGGDYTSQVELNYADKRIEQLQQRIEKAIEYIENYDVFKEFSFPLMKRDEENQIKSSIKYEFDTSIKKNLLKILKGE